MSDLCIKNDAGDSSNGREKAYKLKGEKVVPGSSDPDGSYGSWWFLVDPSGSCGSWRFLWILVVPVDPGGSCRCLTVPDGAWRFLMPGGS